MMIISYQWVNVISKDCSVIRPKIQVKVIIRLTLSVYLVLKVITLSGASCITFYVCIVKWIIFITNFYFKKVTLISKAQTFPTICSLRMLGKWLSTSPLVYHEFRKSENCKEW
jgi:hypothetical protein